MTKEGPATVLAIRLAAEAYAVLTPDQLKEIGESMDLLPFDVRELFEENEKLWDQIKSRLGL